MKSRLFSLTLIFTILFSFINISDIQGQFPSGKSIIDKLNIPNSLFQHNPNSYDNLKKERPELTTGVKIGKLKEGITLQFEDGTTIKGGQTFTPNPSKYTDGWVNPANGFSELFKDSKGQKVTIKRTGKSDMYGIFEYSKVYEECSGLPSARSYFVNIPDNYFNNAEGGNITVIYEYYSCKPIEEIEVETSDAKKRKNKKKGKPENDTVKVKESNYTTWVLWISDVSF